MIGDNIRALREVRRLTQRELADLIGVSVETVSLWERSRCKPSVDQLIPLADALQCSVDLILRMGDPIPEDEAAINEALRLVLRSAPMLDRRILLHAYSCWQGDVHALMQVVAAYMALVDEQARADASGMVLWRYEQEAAAGKIDPACPEVDCSYSEAAWRLIAAGKSKI